MKQTILAIAGNIIALSLVCSQSYAQIDRETVEQHPYYTAGVHHPYIVPQIHDTPAVGDRGAAAKTWCEVLL